MKMYLGNPDWIPSITTCILNNWGSSWEIRGCRCTTSHKRQHWAGRISGITLDKAYLRYSSYPCSTTAKIEQLYTLTNCRLMFTLRGNTENIFYGAYLPPRYSAIFHTISYPIQLHPLSSREAKSCCQRWVESLCWESQSRSILCVCLYISVCIGEKVAECSSVSWNLRTSAGSVLGSAPPS